MLGKKHRLFLWVNPGSKWVKASHYNSSLLVPLHGYTSTKSPFSAQGLSSPLFKNSLLSPVLPLNPQQLSWHFNTGVGSRPTVRSCDSLLAWENTTMMSTCSCQHVYWGPEPWGLYPGLTRVQPGPLSCIWLKDQESNNSFCIEYFAIA